MVEKAGFRHWGQSGICDWNPAKRTYVHVSELVMTITKEIPSEQMRSLDLHQGDSLRVVAELGSTLLIQIVKAATQPARSNKGRAGDWARKYAGAARNTGAETTEDVRMAHFRDKYGI